MSALYSMAATTISTSCYPEEKWKPEMLQTVSTSRKPAQMVWASIWLNKCGRARRSPLVIMERDSNAPRGGYSAQSYIQALKNRLLPHWRRSQLFKRGPIPLRQHVPQKGTVTITIVMVHRIVYMSIVTITRAYTQPQ
jgi:hypothetical protein